MKVMLTDRSWPGMVEVARDLASVLDEHGHELFFLSYHRKSKKTNNFSIINVNDCDQGISLNDLQSKYDFSLWRPLCTERSYFDFTSLNPHQIYSRLKKEEIEENLRKYINAMDFLVSSVVDVVYDNAFDTFISTTLSYLTRFHNKRFYSIYLNYYDDDSLLFFDKSNWTSSEIKNRYYHNYELLRNNDIDLVELSSINEYFSEKKGLYLLPLNNLKTRIIQLIVREKGFEPISLPNLVYRRIINYLGPIRVNLFLKIVRSEKISGHFLVYPMHVSPEAALLGTTPELADQISLIKNISINLPYGIKLYIKEHPHQKYGTGACTYGMLKAISSLPNVELLHPSVNMANIVKNPGFISVVGINGTVLLEAMIDERPAIVFGEPYYFAEDYFIKINKYCEIYNVVNKLICEGFAPNQKARFSMLKAITQSAVKIEGVGLSNRSFSQIDFAKGYNRIILKHIESLVN